MQLGQANVEQNYVPPQFFRFLHSFQPIDRGPMTEMFGS